MVHFQAMMFLKTVRKISPLLKIQKAVKSVCFILLCPNDFFLWKYFILNTIFKTFFIFYLNITIYIPRGFPGGTGGKEPACPCRRHGIIPGSERSPGEGMTAHSSILAGESRGQRRLVGYDSWGLKESDTTEAA